MKKPKKVPVLEEGEPSLSITAKPKRVMPVQVTWTDLLSKKKREKK